MVQVSAERQALCYKPVDFAPDATQACCGGDPPAVVRCKVEAMQPYDAKPIPWLAAK